MISSTLSRSAFLYSFRRETLQAMSLSHQDYETSLRVKVCSFNLIKVNLLNV